MNPQPEMQSVRFRYEESVEHLEESADQVPPYRVHWWFWLILGTVGGLLSFVEWRKHDKMWFLPSVLVFVIGWLITSRRFQRWQNRRSIRAWHRAQIGKTPSAVVCEMGDAGVFVATHQGTSTHYPWQALVRIVERPKGLLMYIAKETFFWFPKTAFSSPEDFERALKWIELKKVPMERQTP